MKTPIAYYGGKINMLRHILPLLPADHQTYVEPFFGGGAVFFAKSPSRYEIINDKFELAINFYRVCQHPQSYRELGALLQRTLHSEAEYRYAKSIITAPPHVYSDIVRAWAFWLGTNMAFAHKLGAGFAFAKQQSLPCTTARRIDATNAEVCERLRHVQILCRDAVDVVRRFDAADTFFYCDPPYPNSNCGHYSDSKGSYYDLLNVLPTLSGKWLLSSYPTPELSALWRQDGVRHVEIKQALAVSGKLNAGREKVETLTWNYDIPPCEVAE